MYIATFYCLPAKKNCSDPHFFWASDATDAYLTGGPYFIIIVKFCQIWFNKQTTNNEQPVHPQFLMHSSILSVQTISASCLLLQYILHSSDVQPLATFNPRSVHSMSHQQMARLFNSKHLRTFIIFRCSSHQVQTSWFNHIFRGISSPENVGIVLTDGFFGSILWIMLLKKESFEVPELKIFEDHAVWLVFDTDPDEVNDVWIADLWHQLQFTLKIYPGDNKFICFYSIQKHIYSHEQK